MNPTYHCVEAARLEVSRTDGAGEPTLYTVHAHHKPDLPALRLPLTHVPDALLWRFAAGNVAGFHVETLRFGSGPALALPGRPVHAVVALKLRDGTRCVAIPPQWQSERRRRFGWALAAFAAATALTICTPGVTGHLLALALAAFGAAQARAAFELRCVPFKVGLSFGNRERTPNGPII